MEITGAKGFLEYYARIRERTMRLVNLIPEDRLEWTFKTGHFTLGDLARHIAAIERLMFLETIRANQSRYAGCGRDLADGLEAVCAFMAYTHAESLEIIGALNHADLERKCLTPDGASIRVAKWLRAMVEHEIHHRGQIYLMLAMLEVPTPPLFGLTSETVIEKSRRAVSIEPSGVFLSG